MRLAAVWDPNDARRRLCVVGGSGLAAGGEKETYSDVSELLARWGGSLENAVHAAGVSSENFGPFDDLAEVEPVAGLMHLVAPAAPLEVWAAGVTYERSRD